MILAIPYMRANPPIPRAILKQNKTKNLIQRSKKNKKNLIQLSHCFLLRMAQEI